MWASFGFVYVSGKLGHGGFGAACGLGWLAPKTSAGSLSGTDGTGAETRLALAFGF